MVPEHGRPKVFRLLRCRPQIFDNSSDARMPMRDTGGGWQRMRDFSLLSFFFFFNYLFIYGCVGSSFLCKGFSPVAASGGHSSSRCAGLSLWRPLLLRSTGSRRAGSVVVAHGPSCSTACGILPDQGSNPCPLHWQADSKPLRHQGSPPSSLYLTFQDAFMPSGVF